MRYKCVGCGKETPFIRHHEGQAYCNRCIQYVDKAEGKKLARKRQEQMVNSMLQNPDEVMRALPSIMYGMKRRNRRKYHGDESNV